METSLHRELKHFYAGRDAEFEAPFEGYRIDVISRGRLVEIQHGALAAIRDKIASLVESHKVVVVKPIVVRKHLVKLDGQGGDIVGRRLSPKRGRWVDLFHELVHFTRVFPHKNLTLDVPLVDIEEHRFPGHGRRRRWRESDFVVEDQHLIGIESMYRLRTAADLVRMLPRELPARFDTADLAKALDVPRWVAQRAAYSLRETGAAEEVAKQGNTRIYKIRRRGGRPPIVAPPKRLKSA